MQLAQKWFKVVVRKSLTSLLLPIHKQLKGGYAKEVFLEAAGYESVVISVTLLLLIFALLTANSILGTKQNSSGPMNWLCMEFYKAYERKK